jgi:hypothetical protein
MAMVKLKLEITQATYEQLIEIAFRERRPTHWQAEVLLEQAVAQHADPCPPSQGARGHGNTDENDEAEP